eukprot:2762015-Prymnesium_polylepis.1
MARIADARTAKGLGVVDEAVLVRADPLLGPRVEDGHPAVREAGETDLRVERLEQPLGPTCGGVERRLHLRRAALPDCLLRQHERASPASIRASHAGSCKVPAGAVHEDSTGANAVVEVAVLRHVGQRGPMDCGYGVVQTLGCVLGIVLRHAPSCSPLLQRNEADDSQANDQGPDARDGAGR